MFIRFALSASLLLAAPARAGFSEAQRAWESGAGSATWRKLVIELVDGGYPFAAVPYMKEYLIQNRAPLDEDLDEAFDRMVSRTGVRPFETLPDGVLGQSRSAIARYILAKKHFRRGRLPEALRETSGISESHAVFPFAAHLRAAAFGAQGKHEEAESAYRACVSSSASRYNAESNPVKLRQLLINRDSCVAGLARTAFGKGAYAQADLLYLDIPKTSYIWPEILHEEAWNSYHLKNYNRTLGKLVSYKAPVFDFVFNPEIEVLKSLAYLRLCLYKDVNKTVEDFYSQWLEPSKSLRTFLVKQGRDYDSFYELVTRFERDRQAKDFLMHALLLSISKDAAWQEMKQSLLDALDEFNRLKGAGGGRFHAALMRNVKDVVEGHQKLLGSYARAQFHEKYQQLVDAFSNMSFVKLEVLARKKQALYEEGKDLKGKRGDVRYIQRNDKQYFWDFDGEFWADELGDYVFALRSEC